MVLSDREKMVGVIAVSIVIIVFLTLDFGSVETGPIVDPTLNISVLDTTITDMNTHQIFELNISTSVTMIALGVEEISLQAVDGAGYTGITYHPFNDFDAQLALGVSSRILLFQIPSNIDISNFQLTVSYVYFRDNQQYSGVYDGTFVII